MYCDLCRYKEYKEVDKRDTTCEFFKDNFAERTDNGQLKVPLALREQSMAAGDDNLYNDITQTSCAYYIGKKKKWLSSFDDNEEGIKLKYALAPMVAARGLVPGSDMMTYFDGCVIPDTLKKAYNIDDNCILTTENNVKYTLDKTSPVTYPQGCFIDFSGNLGEARKGKEITESEFNNFLKVAYSGMNSMDEELIGKLKSGINSRDSVINDKNKAIKSKDSQIQSLNQAQEALQRKLNRMQGTEPSFMYTVSNSWIQPKNDWYVARYEELGIDSPSQMTITFWINIRTLSKNWRNILHIYSPQLTENGVRLEYDPEEDLDRKPAIFISPNKKSLYICHTIQENVENCFQVDNVDGTCMVALSWHDRILNVYINRDKVYTHTYNNDLMKPDINANLYVCDRFYDEGGFEIRYLTFYNTSLTHEKYLEKFETESANVTG